MKRTINLLMAALLILGLAQCKKEQTQNNDTGNRVDITLRLDHGNAKVHVTDEGTTAPVDYDEGDIMLVASDGKYVGQLTYQPTGVFTGSINATYATEGENLQFIFVGQQTLNLPAEGSSDSFTFSLADQSAAPAVFSTALSTEEYSSTVASYTAHLKNRSALVKFAVDANVPAVTIRNLTNNLSVSWNGEVSSNGTGDILTHGTGAVRYAVVAEDQAAITEGTAFATGYIGTFSIPTAAFPNAYITSANMTMTRGLGPFTVDDAGTKVYFSPGNLQWSATGGGTTRTTHDVAGGGTAAGTWRFAVNQWDFVGGMDSDNGYIILGNVYEGGVKCDNALIAEDYSGWIDLFGWGTSGYHDTNDSFNINYYPWSKSTSIVDETNNYFGYGPSLNMTDRNLTGTSANYDWGVYNAIYNPQTNLTDDPGTWRTLTQNEWNYVYSGRINASLKFGRGNVNGVNGLILLPDEWALPAGLNFTPGRSDYINSYTKQEWAKMETNDAVFLPNTGGRSGTWLYDIGDDCSYSSTTHSYSGGRAFFAYYAMYGVIAGAASTSRCNGISVRLVRDNW